MQRGSGVVRIAGGLICGINRIKRERVGSSALGVDTHSLEQRDCLIGIFRPTEKNRVLQVAEIRAAGRINTGLLKPLKQCVEVSCRMIFERK